MKFLIKLNYYAMMKTCRAAYFYSSRFLLDDPNGWADSLRFNYYRTPALIAPMNWIDTTAPQRPHVARIESWRTE